MGGSYFVEHAGEAADGVRSSREAEETDAIAFRVVLHEEFVGVLDMDTETAPNGHVDGGGESALQESVPVIGADS